MTKVLECECVPAVHYLTGEIMGGASGRNKARRILEKREGPPPFGKAVCRHLCENDSMAPNGFVCTVHTTWGTRSENEMDKSPETRAKGANSPHNPNKLQTTCPHCGKTGQKVNMARWHGDNCKLKPRN